MVCRLEAHEVKLGLIAVWVYTTLIPSRNEFPYFFYGITSSSSEIVTTGWGPQFCYERGDSSRVVRVAVEKVSWWIEWCQWRYKRHKLTKPGWTCFSCVEIGRGCHFSCQKQSKSFWRPWRRLSKVGANRFQRESAPCSNVVKGFKHIISKHKFKTYNTSMPQLWAFGTSVFPCWIFSAASCWELEDARS